MNAAVSWKGGFSFEMTPEVFVTDLGGNARSTASSGKRVDELLVKYRSP